MTSEQTYVSPDNAYQQALDAGQFTIQQCDDCNQSLFYPRNLCPHCGSYAISWITPSGNGTVYATTTVRKRPEKGGNYNVSVIELEEGPRLMSRVDGLAPDEVKIGQRVQVKIIDNDGNGLVIFEAV